LIGQQKLDNIIDKNKTESKDFSCIIWNKNIDWENIDKTINKIKICKKNIK